MFKRNCRIVSVLSFLCCVVGGCVSDRPKAMPTDAVYKDGGKPGHGKHVEYAADQDGTVFVTDPWDNSILYSAEIKKGTLVVIDSDSHQVTVDGKPVELKGKLLGTGHLIYLSPKK